MSERENIPGKTKRPKCQCIPKKQNYKICLKRGKKKYNRRSEGTPKQAAGPLTPMPARKRNFNKAEKHRRGCTKNTGCTAQAI